VVAASPYLGGVPAGGSDFICDSDPFLSANGAYILCGGYRYPRRKPHVFYYPYFPKGPVTQGFGEFSAKTGKLIAVLGAWRAPVQTTGVMPHTHLPVTVITLPYLLWASPNAKILIGEEGGHAFVLRDGRRQAIPWSSHISTALSSNVPGASW
jgi:hypothetical protein